jgi:hypothetical protein
MRLRCDRPGCGVDAAVRFGFDATRQLVWIAPLDDGPTATAGSLCRRHADSFVAPRGWWVDDRRVDATLFRPPDPTPPLGMPAPRRSRTHADDVEQPMLLPDEPAAEIPAAEIPVAEEPPTTAVEMIDWTPVPPTSSDDELFGDVTTPLLAKAFGRPRPRLAPDT